MAITIAKDNRRRIFSIITLIILIIIFLVLLFMLMRDRPLKTIIKNEAIEPPELNFISLQNPILSQLEPFFFTPEIVENIGRENPFAPSTSTSATSTKTKK